jgi:hypothetical protein
MKDRLIRLVQLRNEILELLPYKANVYPWDQVTGEWGDGTMMSRCRSQISKLKELGYNKNRRIALKQVERDLIRAYKIYKRKQDAAA